MHCKQTDIVNEPYGWVRNRIKRRLTQELQGRFNSEYRRNAVTTSDKNSVAWFVPTVYWQAVAARGENSREGSKFPSLFGHPGLPSWPSLKISGVSSHSSRPNPINIVIFSCSYRYIDSINFSFINPKPKP